MSGVIEEEEIVVTGTRVREEDENSGGGDNFDLMFWSVYIPQVSFLQDFLGAGSDLEGLFGYDSNRDGFLTAADNRFSEFLVWRDANGNGRSERTELFTLGEIGIVSISLERRNIKPLDLDADRNQILATSSFHTADGSAFQVGDVALFTNVGDCGCHAMTPPLQLLGAGDGNVV